jgi:hypothetical protein
MVLPGEGCKPAIKGETYRIDMNPLGAVSAIVDDEHGGKTKLGMRPSEFQWKSPYGVVGDHLWVRETWQPGTKGISFKADFQHPEKVLNAWKPSIHLPRKYSRILLEVTDVRVQRLTEISDQDARAEGAMDMGLPPNMYVKGFRELWNSINAKRGYGWDTNPWVWSICFNRIKP